ncbi:MAG TPA: metal-dependent hydrolase [Terriglobales bacterium]|nr:metal-dependent hydrolase [Terriglobales bacterium]
MFIGHFAIGFAAKKFAPRTSLAALLAAPLLSDMLWPVFLLLGWERARIDPGNTRFTPIDLTYFPWSHSLLMCIAWASAFALIYYWIARYLPGTIVIWIGVVSHWILDWVTHRPDMPLYPGGPRFGLGLWNSIAGTLVVETLMFATGVWLYVRSTRARDSIGHYGFLAYVGLLMLAYIGDRFSDPPTSIADIAWTGIVAIAILIPWAWWFDHHRVSRTGGQV